MFGDGSVLRFLQFIEKRERYGTGSVSLAQAVFERGMVARTKIERLPVTRKSTSQTAPFVSLCF